ncbi:hypothetical protein FJQ98_01750 [Lysinibacillus agricola]|uniref:Uncharacterized protein n=1 Tax=Lysinibacillus agricola TaxID=2590012 RepID=A0ABX7AU85_9BACI|nr:MULTISPECIES: hypothetical protein [Lysinibacillus]KOS61313.1 hypothetical protein AN161_18745 [Lysinibacillus sp. FJAT-14222]QQP12842.1 hypothetical protein FJQ98_01750 [Lysinibacillus agricola]
MEKRTTIKQIFISIGLFIAVYLLLNLIFDVIAMSLSPEYNEIADEYTHPLVTLLSVLFAAIVTIIEYVVNKIKYTEFFKNNAENIKSNINIFTNKRIRMYKKANLIFQGYLEHEKGAHTAIAQERNNQSIQIHSVIEFKQALESYPELKGGENVTQLLKQMENAGVVLWDPTEKQVFVKTF